MIGASFLKPISFPRISDPLEKKQPCPVNSAGRALFPGLTQGAASHWANELGMRLPCILYEAKTSFEVTQVSSSIEELLGIGCESIISCRGFWKEWLFDDDLPLIEAKLQELENSDFVSFAHRMFSGARLPIWVSHSVMKYENEGILVLRGCLIPILNDKRICALDHTLITRFIHKLGNHFQLLNLVVGSLKKNLPETREAELLFDTLDKAAEMTRSFADCAQVPSWLSGIQLAEVLKTAIEKQREAFSAKGVLLQEHYDESWDDASVSGDPFLLEAALNHVVADAVESVGAGGAVTVNASIDSGLATSAVARLQLVQSQCDDPARDGESACYPKPDHDGLRITMAARFIEMHGGLLRTARAENKGIAVEISLPITFLKERSCE